MLGSASFAVSTFWAPVVRTLSRFVIRRVAGVEDQIHETRKEPVVMIETACMVLVVVP